jgi:hypothetical protein
MTGKGQLFLDELEKAWDEINLVIRRLKSNKIEQV